MLEQHQEIQAILASRGNFMVEREIPPWNLSTDNLEFDNMGDDGSGELSLQRAAAAGREADVAAMLVTAEGRAMLEAQPPPLFLACMGGHEGCVRALLEAEANPNSITISGRTALFAACRGAHAGCATELLQQHADPNARDESGRTALLAACAKQHVECVQLLLTCGADANLPAQDANIEPPPDLTPVMLLAGSPVGMEPEGPGWRCLQVSLDATALLHT